jgi:hypothetical protein
MIFLLTVFLIHRPCARVLENALDFELRSLSGQVNVEGDFLVIQTDALFQVDRCWE